jgi:hypothetical protein
VILLLTCSRVSRRRPALHTGAQLTRGARRCRAIDGDATSFELRPRSRADRGRAEGTSAFISQQRQLAARHLELVGARPGFVRDFELPRVRRGCTYRIRSIRIWLAAEAVVAFAAAPQAWPIYADRWLLRGAISAGMEVAPQ